MTASQRRPLSGFALALTIAAASLNVACDGVDGNGEVISEYREVGAFSTIEIHGSITLVADVMDDADGANVVVATDSNLQEYIDTRVDGSRLIVETNTNVAPTDGIHLRVRTDELVEVVTHGSSCVNATGIDAEQFRLRTSGSSCVYLEGVAAGFDIAASGSSHIEAQDLMANDVAVDTSGSSSVELCAFGRLDVEASGSSFVRYTCDPDTVTRDLSGSATVR